MKHRMTVQNASSGLVYELMLEGGDDGYVAVGRMLNGVGAIVPSGWTTRFVDRDAHRAFTKVKRELEDVDPGTIDQDWDFGEPLPPWLVE